jgi:hypothetical protein
VFDKQPVTNLFFADAVAGSYAQAFTIEPRVFGANVTVRF